MHKALNVNDYFQVDMRSGKMHSECGGPAPPSAPTQKPSQKRAHTYSQKYGI